MMLCYQNGKRVLVRGPFIFWPGCGGWFNCNKNIKILRKAKSKEEGYQWVNMMKRGW